MNAKWQVICVSFLVLVGCCCKHEVPSSNAQKKEHRIQDHSNGLIGRSVLQAAVGRGSYCGLQQWVQRGRLRIIVLTVVMRQNESIVCVPQSTGIAPCILRQWISTLFGLYDSLLNMLLFCFHEHVAQITAISSKFDTYTHIFYSCPCLSTVLKVNTCLFWGPPVPLPHNRA